MLSLLLAADAVVKVGAAIGGGISVIGVGIGIGRIGGNAMGAMARQPEKIGDLRSSMIIATASIEGVALFSIIIALLSSFVQKPKQQMVSALSSVDVENTFSTD